jgi:hypothetical protein
MTPQRHAKLREILEVAVNSGGEQRLIPGFPIDPKPSLELNRTLLEPAGGWIGPGRFERPIRTPKLSG